MTTCHGGGDTELAVDSTGASTSTTSRSRTSASRARTTTAARSRAATRASRTRSSTGSGTRSTATRRPAARSTSTNDEVGNGNVAVREHGPATTRSSCTARRSAGAGADRRARVRPAEPHHAAAAPATRGSWATTRSARSRRRPARTARRCAHAPCRHVYVVHDDGSLSEDPDRALLPGRVRTADRERQRPERPELRRPARRRPRRLRRPSRTGGNFPTLAIDKAGNLYAVWEQAPYDRAASRPATRRSMYAYSTDEGNHWSAPVHDPDPGLANNVFAWAAAGDDGRVDIALVRHAVARRPRQRRAERAAPNGGPGLGRRLLERLLHADAERRTRSAVTFSTPVVASEHPIRRGSDPDDPRRPVRRRPNNQSRRTGRSATSSSSGSAARARRRSRTPTRPT